MRRRRRRRRPCPQAEGRESEAEHRSWEQAAQAHPSAVEAIDVNKLMHLAGVREPEEESPPPSPRAGSS